jgi:pyruvate dehydrogenase (quinone)/pyruvate oxidase
MGPAHVENVADLACRTALAYRGVAHLTIPVDIQDFPANRKRASNRNIADHTSDRFAPFGAQANPGALQKAAAVLNTGHKVAILAGQGALGATEQLERLAEVLGGPIIKPLLGKGTVPDDSPYTTGSIGLLGTAPSQKALEECDVVLLVGTSFPYIEFLPKPDQAKGVQIDIDPMRIGLRFPVDVGLVGDARVVLDQLLPMLTRKQDRSFLGTAQSGMRDWWQLMEEQSGRMDTPMKPQVVAWELGKRLRSDAIISSDSGTIATWFARQIPVRRGQLYSLSGTLASMANGLPYTIAAQLAHPDRQCIGFVGDGGLAMLMAEFATAVKYQLPIKIVVIKNNVLGQIKWEQMVFLGNPEYEVELQPIDFVKVAEACGGAGFRIEDPRECGTILDRALAHQGPAIIEAVVDPLEPPMPPKITREQAVHFAESLLRGEPNRTKIAMTAIGDKMRELI